MKRQESAKNVLRTVKIVVKQENAKSVLKVSSSKENQENATTDANQEKLMLTEFAKSVEPSTAYTVELI